MSAAEGGEEAGGGGEEACMMFANVWVKLEVEEEQEVPLTPDTLHLPLLPRDRKPKKRKPFTKPTQLLRCDQCDYTTKYKPSLKFHVLGHSDAKPFVCSHCPYSTKYPISLKRHIFIQHECKNDPDKIKQLPIFHCSTCAYTTYFKWNLHAHERKHNLEKKYKCTLCPYSTAYNHNFVKHSRTHKKLDTTYHCDKCPFSTKFEGHITRHLAKIHFEVSEKASRCEFCPYSTKTKWRLNIHKNRSRQERALQCAHCDFVTQYHCEYREHKHLHTDKVMAQIGNQKWMESMFLKGSELNSNQIEQDSQKLCEQDRKINKAETPDEGKIDDPGNGENYELSKKEDPDYYLNEKNNFNPSQNTSNTSSSSLSISQNSLNMSQNGLNMSENGFNMSQNGLNMSQNVLSMSQNGLNMSQNGLNMSQNGLNMSQNSLNLSQNGSNMSSLIVSQLTEHEKTNHYLLDPNCEVEWGNIQVIESSDIDRPFQCVTCSYRAKFKASVQRHFQRHHTEHNKPFKCVNCDFSTKTKDQIALHNKRSRTDDIITCKLCPFTTNFKCQYSMHEKAHFPFKCVYCEYTCKKKYDMQKHFSTAHLGGGLRCARCPFRAARRDALAAHEAAHGAGAKPYKCPRCTYTAARRALLTAHVARAHDRAGLETVLTDDKLESLRRPDPAAEVDGSVLGVLQALRAEPDPLATK